MGNYSTVLSTSLRQANIALESNRTDEARIYLVQAGEAALMLAKNSFGKEREKYLLTYKDIKKALENLSDAPSESRAPTFTGGATPISTDDGRSVKSVKDEERSNGKPAKEPFEGQSEMPERNAPLQSNDSLSPRYLSEYIGQPQAVVAVKDLIEASLLTGKAMPHIMLYGSHGLGKTTFGRIIANELKVDFVEVNVSKITPMEMVAIFKKLKPRDVVFMDEIHNLPTVVAESILYTAMLENRFVYTEGKGKQAHSEEVILPPFTLIGATTEIGKLAKPFIHRAIQIHLEEYSDTILGRIIQKSFYKLGYKISEEDALYVAIHSRSNPRTANNFVKRISDKALVRYATQNNLRAYGVLDSVEAIRKLNITVTKDVISEFFTENGIDQNGLESADRELLRVMIERYNGGPVGLDTLSKVMNESNNVVAQKYETYLVKKGYMKIERDGRIVMPAGYIALGYPVPKEKESEGEKFGAEKRVSETKYETRKVIASLVCDEIKCEKIEALIEYPDNPCIPQESLDELFPDVVQPIVEEPKHRCALIIDLGERKRELICDSFLESRFASCLAQVGYVKDIKAQTLELSYISQALANKRYYPDFVIRDYKGRIAVIEMKNFEMMSYHLNIDKYEKLKEYCVQQGYGYAEIMKEYNAEEYISVEQMLRKEVNQGLSEDVYAVIAQKEARGEEGAYTKEDFDRWLRIAGNEHKTDIFVLLLHDRRLKNIDRAGTSLKIVKN